MKLTNLIGVLALAGVVAIACNTGPPITGEPAPGPGPGDGGSNGGTGGISGDGACTTPDNVAVYDELTYTTGKGVTEIGTEAASAIASDCLRGAPTGVPPIPAEDACGTETLAVVACFERCPAAEFDPLVEALVTCVIGCQDDVIQEITGGSLSAECSGCYGETVACGAAKCTSPQCVSEPLGDFCTNCRCEAGCIPTFDVCTGIPNDDCG